MDAAARYGNNLRQPGNNAQLQALINSTSGEEKVNNMLLHVKSQSGQYNDSSLKIALDALKLADSLKNPTLIAKANYYVAIGYYFQNNFEEAEQAHLKSMENLDEIEDVKFFVKNLVFNHSILQVSFRRNPDGKTLPGLYPRKWFLLDNVITKLIRIK